MFAYFDWLQNLSAAMKLFIVEFRYNKKFNVLLTDCRLSIIIDATGAASYHGFLPVVMRDCIQHMIGMLLLVCHLYPM